MATLNLWGWFDSWPRRREVLERHWPQVDADIVFIQEGCYRQGHDQVSEVAGSLGYGHVVRGQAEEGNDSGETIAVLSRLPLGDFETILLPDSTPRRCAISALVDADGPLKLVATHTAFRPDSARRRQIEALCALEGPRMVLGGDLNAPVELVRPFADAAGLEDVLAWQPTPTWPSSAEQFVRAWREHTGRKPRFSVEPRRLDYLLSRGIAVEHAQVLPLGDSEEGFASDHSLLVGRYRI